MYNVKKKTCLGVLDRGEQGDDNETDLKEGGGIEMSSTVLSIYAMHALLRFLYILLTVSISTYEINHLTTKTILCCSTILWSFFA